MDKKCPPLLSFCGVSLVYRVSTPQSLAMANVSAAEPMDTAVVNPFYKLFTQRIRSPAEALSLPSQCPRSRPPKKPASSPPRRPAAPASLLLTSAASTQKRRRTFLPPPLYFTFLLPSVFPNSAAPRLRGPSVPQSIERPGHACIYSRNGASRFCCPPAFQLCVEITSPLHLLVCTVVLLRKS